MASPLRNKRFYYKSAEETETLECQSEWKAISNIIVTRRA